MSQKLKVCKNEDLTKMCKNEELEIIFRNWKFSKIRKNNEFLLTFWPLEIISTHQVNKHLNVKSCAFSDSGTKNRGFPPKLQSWPSNDPKLESQSEGQHWIPGSKPLKLPPETFLTKIHTFRVDLEISPKIGPDVKIPGHHRIPRSKSCYFRSIASTKIIIITHNTLTNPPQTKLPTENLPGGAAPNPILPVILRISTHHLLDPPPLALSRNIPGQHQRSAEMV